MELVQPHQAQLISVAVAVEVVKINYLVVVDQV